MIKAAVIGHPISQSKSPLIHQYWIEKYGCDGSYEAVDIPCESLEKDMHGLVDAGYAGFNVTIPHKENMLQLCDELDDTAKKIGAVNTVTVRQGKLHGTNTDAFGFLHNILEEVPDFDFTAKPSVLLGSGGAARAVVHALLEQNAQKIKLVNRTRSKAEALKAESLNPGAIEIVSWNDREEALAGCGLLANTTSLGMDSQPPLEIELDSLPQDAVVNDIVYKPLETDLLRRTKEKNCRTVSGIGMLLHQARPAFEQWFKILPEIDEDLKRKVLT